MGTWLSNSTHNKMIGPSLMSGAKRVAGDALEGAQELAELALERYEEIDGGCNGVRGHQGGSSLTWKRMEL